MRYQLWKGNFNIYKTKVSPYHWFPGWEASGAEVGADASGILLPARARKSESSSFCSLRFLLFHTSSTFPFSEGTALTQETKLIHGGCWTFTDLLRSFSPSLERSVCSANPPLTLMPNVAHETIPWTTGLELKLGVVSVFFYKTLNTGAGDGMGE